MRVTVGTRQSDAADMPGLLTAHDGGPGPATASRRRLQDGLLTRPGVAVSVSVTGIVLVILVGAGAPNNNTLRLPLPFPLLAPMPGLAATLATVASITLSSLGLVGMLGAHRRGWNPSPRKLFGLGALAVAVVVNLTPVGSSDSASYAAYGRIAALGGDPYTTTPAQLGGAYAHWVGTAWLHSPSVYGPVATWLQTTAAQIGGHRPWLTIWLLMLANGAAFLAAGYVLLKTAPDPVKAGLIWVANPVLIVELVAGGHLDTSVAALAVCAVALTAQPARPRTDLLIGLLIGLACSIKISAALLGLALLWPLLRAHAWGRIARQSAACLLVLLCGYGFYGVHALAPLSAASHMVSAPTLWAPLQQLGQATVGQATTSTVISVSWPLLMFALAWLIHRRIPPEAPLTVSVPFALAFAWILVAPWSMPWYTAIVWSTAALIPRGGPLVRWLILTTAILALGHNGGGHGSTW
ncbi:MULTISPECIES: hypothetical protein [unclassified Streptomyces]|uniref:hypothetical protein n=1 Tax=unclassified Streptomyces TaxID=2593676 RepID=UPI002E2014D9